MPKKVPPKMAALHLIRPCSSWIPSKPFVKKSRPSTRARIACYASQHSYKVSVNSLLSATEKSVHVFSVAKTIWRLVLCYSVCVFVVTGWDSVEAGVHERDDSPDGRGRRNRWIRRGCFACCSLRILCR